MPWGRLDDSLYDHPKLDRLPSPSAARGGRAVVAIDQLVQPLPDRWPHPAEPGREARRIAELAALLVAAGLYEETADGYLVHDFLEFNDSRESVLKKRAVEAKRQADWREKKRQCVTA
jgi:hypothetical protein